MSLLTQAYLLERYGPRLNTKQLAEVLGVTAPTLLNQISAGACPVKTYLESGRRYADYRDVAAYFDAARQKAA